MPVHKDGIQTSTEVRKVKKRKRKTASVAEPSNLAIDVSGVKFNGASQDLAAKLSDRLFEAAEAFAAERYRDAENLLSSIENLCPGVVEVAELRGLANYSLGKWKVALGWLEAFADQTGSIEQHPVLADCYRALKRWDQVEDKWLDVADASPGPEVLEEMRIVKAGALSDQGKIVEAIAFLEKPSRSKGKPSVYVLRRMYVLATLYEKAGNTQKAKQLYSAIVGSEPQFGDVAERLADLS